MLIHQEKSGYDHSKSQNVGILLWKSGWGQFYILVTVHRRMIIDQNTYLFGNETIVNKENCSRNEKMIRY